MYLNTTLNILKVNNTTDFAILKQKLNIEIHCFQIYLNSFLNFNCLNKSTLITWTKYKTISQSYCYKNVVFNHFLKFKNAFI